MLACIHGTSPIRRYPDLVNQRMVLAYLDGMALPYTFDDLSAISEHVNQRMAIAKMAA